MTIPSTTIPSGRQEALKWLALASMTIDHIGALLLYDYPPLRIVGRAAFPIFAFLVAYHLQRYPTSADIARYLRRLIGFGLFGQAAYSLTFWRAGLSDGLNILFEFGGLALVGYAYRTTRTGLSGMGEKMAVFCLFLCGLLLSLLSEYGLPGLLFGLAAFVYTGRPSRWRGAAVAALAVLANVWMLDYGGRVMLAGGAVAAAAALAACSAHSLPPIRISRMPRYFFYLYYPAHLLLLAALL